MSLRSEEATYWAKDAATEEEACTWLFENHPNFAQGRHITVGVDAPLQDPEEILRCVGGVDLPNPLTLTVSAFA